MAEKFSDFQSDNVHSTGTGVKNSLIEITFNRFLSKIKVVSFISHLIPWCGGAGEAVVDGCAKTFHRDGHNGDAFIRLAIHNA